ncbi:MAG: PepSY-associated TM helix domain-containing protein, partial [Perlucidibaca sp.]
MRAPLALLHRWFGLFMAVFLFISGLTGAVISWDHELDEWLNPQLFRSDTPGQRLPALALADRLERDDPRLLVTFLPLTLEPGHSLT